MKIICDLAHPDLHNRIENFCELYGLAEEAYKIVQPIVLKIDDKIHNEFKYCSRALRELLQELTSDTVTELSAIDKLQRAEHAVKNALNDSVDLIVGYAVTSIKEMASVDTGKELVVFIHDLPIIVKSLKHISRQIEASRNDTSLRIEIYRNIIKSDEFKKVVDFCENIEVILNNIQADYSRLVKEKRRFLITIFLTVFGLIMTTLGVIEKMPEFLKWLSKFFPSLSAFN